MSFCVLCGCIAVWARFENQDLWTTDFTDHTDEERPDSKSVQSMVQVFAVQVFVVEIVVVLNFVVLNFVVSDAIGHRRTHVGRSSDAKRRERSSPQVVLTI